MENKEYGDVIGDRDAPYVNRARPPVRARDGRATASAIHRFPTISRSRAARRTASTPTAPTATFRPATSSTSSRLRAHVEGLHGGPATPVLRAAPAPAATPRSTTRSCTTTTSPAIRGAAAGRPARAPLRGPSARPAADVRRSSRRTCATTCTTAPWDRRSLPGAPGADAPPCRRPSGLSRPHLGRGDERPWLLRRIARRPYRHDRRRPAGAPRRTSAARGRPLRRAPNDRGHARSGPSRECRRAGARNAQRALPPPTVTAVDAPRRPRWWSWAFWRGCVPDVPEVRHHSALPSLPRSRTREHN